MVVAGKVGSASKSRKSAPAGALSNGSGVGAVVGVASLESSQERKSPSEVGTGVAEVGDLWELVGEREARKSSSGFVVVAAVGGGGGVGEALESKRKSRSSDMVREERKEGEERDKREERKERVECRGLKERMGELVWVGDSNRFSCSWRLS